MKLRVAVQMDPLERINVAGNSTFAIMLKAQELGHEVYCHAAGGSEPRGGAPVDDGLSRHCPARRRATITALGSHCVLDLGKDVDVVLMRQDPPFDLGYITASFLLERIQSETLVVNDPASVRNAPEKVWVLDFAQFMPPTAITRSLDLLASFSPNTARS